MFTITKAKRSRTIGSLIAIGTLVAATQVGGLGTSPVQAVDDGVVAWSSPVEVFSTDDIIGSSDIPDGLTGNREAQDRTIVLGNDPGEITSLNIQSQGGNTLSPIDNSFTTDELDFFGATGRERDGDPLTGEGYDEGYAGNIVDGGEVVGLELSDVATDLFKAGAPLGTWAAGLGNESIKASTEHFTVMESILTCWQTNPYDFWKSQADFDAGLPSVPAATAAALDEAGLSCPQLSSPDALDDLSGNPIDLDTLIPNEDSVIKDIAVDPNNAYSVTKKDDGKLLFRWGTAVKRPTDIRFQKSIDLPDEWTDPALAGTRGYRVTRAELVVNHNITNNPNDQIRPEDWENEAATGRTPDYEIVDGNWVSTTACYEGDGDFIPAGTTFRDPTNTVVGIPASDLEGGFTPAWYTTIQRDPFEWSYRTTSGHLLGSHDPVDLDNLTPDQVTAGFTGAETLVSGPRWRLTSNKFGQDLPGLEIPAIECSQPPYQKGTIRYETGEPITTTVNLLDWSPTNDRWADDPASSPLAYSAGWITTWSGSDTVPGQIIDNAEDALRCASTNDAGECVTELGTTLTDRFDVSFYIKGDIKPAQIYDVQLILEYEAEPVDDVAFDHGDAPDSYGTATVPAAARSVVTDTSPRLGAEVDTEAAGLASTGATGDDLDGTPDDEDGVTLAASVTAGSEASATIDLGGPGYVNGWVDFDGNGTFEADEQVITDLNASGSPSFTVPADALVGATYARFRVTDTSGTGPTGLVGFGEVEDYAIEITAADTTTTTTTTTLPTEPAALAPFTNIVPTRVLDTRITGARLGEWSGSGPLLAGTTAQIPVRSAAGIPADATVAVVNLTATGALASGFLTVFPCGGAVPTISNLNYPATTSRAATAFAPISSTGTICVYTHSTTDVVVDVTGYTPNLGSYTALTPSRLIDTRTTAAVAAGGTLRVTPPASSADALAVSVVAVDAVSPGFLTVYPCSQAKPTTSTVNYDATDASANLTVIANAPICIYSMSATDVVVDLHGQFTEPLLGGQARLLDTRSGTMPAAGATTVINPAASPALAGLTSAAVNLTATDSTVGGYLTVWPCSSPRPTASILNFNAGQVVANLAVVDVTSPICIFNQSPTHVVVDLVAGLS